MNQEPRDIAPGLRKATIITVTVVSILLVLLLKVEARHVSATYIVTFMLIVGGFVAVIFAVLNSEWVRNAKIEHPADAWERRQRERERNKRENDIT